MKTYRFPYGGSCGKGDSWDAEFELSLSDEDAARLEAAARDEAIDFYDVNEITDLYNKVYDAIMDYQVKYNYDEDRLDELREWYEDSDETPSDYELILEDMGDWHIHFPQSLRSF